MISDRGHLAHIAFAGTVIEWRGPAPYFFVAVPDEHVGELKYAAQLASYGWGVVPVQAMVNGLPFSTSLFPKDGGYLLPLKVSVRKSAKIGLGETVRVEICVAGRSLQALA